MVSSPAASHEPARRSGLRARLRSVASTLRGRAPFVWPRQRKRRWLIALLVLVLAYPVLVTGALWTGLAEKLLHSEDLRVEIDNPAYTIWPGKIRMKHVRILGNGSTQFILEGSDLVLNVRLLELFTHRIHVSELAAHDVSYHMRVQVKDTHGIERRVAAYPPLHGLPGANVIRESTREKTESNNADWTVQVEGLDIGVKDLWFFEYRYLGKGHLRGGFLVGPNVMAVTTAVQDLGPGELRFGGEQTIAKDLRGQITADIPRVNPKEHADASFMELVTARVNLRAAVQTLANVSAYAEDVDVTHGAGPLSLDLYLDRGKLGSKSHLEFDTDSVRLMGKGFGVASDWQLRFDASGSTRHLPVVRSRSKATYVSFARGMRVFTIQAHDHEEEAQLDTIQLSRSTDLLAASLRMPTIRSSDLRDLPVVLPESAPVTIESGEARASLKLDMDRNYWIRGPLDASIDALRFTAAAVPIAGTVKLQTQLRVNPKLDIERVDDLRFAVRDVAVRAEGHTTTGWWLNLDANRLAYRGTDPARFDGVVKVRARDLGPILESLAQKDVISKLIPLLTKLGDFRASSTIRTKGPTMDVSLASESDVWDVAGRIYKDEQRAQMALVLGGQAVSVGIANTQGHLEIMPFAKTGWLNDHLRRMPAPLVQMPPEKP